MLLVQKITDSGLIPSPILLDLPLILINALKITLSENSLIMWLIQTADMVFVFSIS